MQIPLECGWTEKAFEFYYAGSVSQTFTIPETLESAHNPSFSIQYTLDFIDPNDHPTWNVFEMKVVDTNTGWPLNALTVAWVISIAVGDHSSGTRI